MNSRMRRRRFLQTSAAAAGTLMLPGKAPAQGGAKPLSGTTLNIACWSAPYAKLVADYIPEFEAATGAKVNYETPSFPIYNQRIDIELSTRGSAYDVLNVTFIYVGRWIGAEWFTPLDDFFKDPKKTPADWDVADFLPGAANAFKDKAGPALRDSVDRRHLHGRRGALRSVREGRQENARHFRRAASTR